MSGKKRPRRHYTTDFKLKVIHEIESGELNAWSARKKYSIPGKMTVKRWLERFEKSHLMLRKKREQPDYLAVSRHADKIEELKDRNRILEAALAEAQVRVLALESLVEVVDEEYKTNVKKKLWFRSIKKAKTKTPIYNVTIAALCDSFGVSRNAYYRRLKKSHINEIQEHAVITRVRAIRDIMPRIGTRKLYHILRNECQGLGRDKLFAILRKNGLLVPPRKKYARTTESSHFLRKYKNLIQNVVPMRPLQIVVSDLTYLTTTTGFIYLFLITDYYSRKIIGYALRKDLSAQGALDAARMAFPESERLENLIHHSDRGIQYCSYAYTNFLHDRKIQISMTEKNHAYENATAERVNGILKSEFYLDQTFISFEHAEITVERVIHVYNTLRPHLKLNLKTPIEVHAA